MGSGSLSKSSSWCAARSGARRWPVLVVDVAVAGRRQFAEHVGGFGEAGGEPLGAPMRTACVAVPGGPFRHGSCRGFGEVRVFRALSRATVIDYERGVCV